MLVCFCRRAEYVVLKKLEIVCFIRMQVAAEEDQKLREDLKVCHVFALIFAKTEICFLGIIIKYSDDFLLLILLLISY